MATDIVSKSELARSPIWFNALLLLDAFAIGGLAVWHFVIDLLDEQMQRTTAMQFAGDILHIEDKMFVYWVSQTGVAFVLVLMTIASYLFLRTRSKTVFALTLGIPVSIGFVLLGLRSI